MPPDTLTANPRRNASLVLLAIIAAILGVWVLRVTYFVTMPLTFSFFLAILVRPVQRWAEARLPRWLRWMGLVLAMLTIVAGVVAAGALLWLSLHLAAGEDTSVYIRRGNEVWYGLVNWARQRDIPLQRHVLETETVGEGLVALSTEVLTRLWVAVAVAVLVFFFTLLMLLEAGEWRSKGQRTFDRPYRHVTADTLSQVAARVRQYLMVRTIVAATAGASGGLLLWALGVDFALLWAVLIFLLNYIPAVGAALGIVPPSVMALIQYDFARALLTMALLVVVQQVIAIFLDPRLEGRALRVSPILVLVSILFWSWVWGLAGALLAVPITVTGIAIAQQVPALQPVAGLFSRGPEYERAHPQK